ncbi:MAG: DUF1934 domain-containing protein [Clostridiales bacterium]|nr:DUF1934 domain-containing protein [Clostridiales bacterium]
MDKPVIISIRGLQSFEDMEDEVIDLVTEGRLVGSAEEGYSLSYQESPVTGLDGTLTTFQIQRDRITLLRVGVVNSQMIFEEGRKHLSLYETPNGALTVGVNTRRARSTLEECGGSIEINYAIEIDHAVAGENAFRISVREPASRIKS